MYLNNIFLDILADFKKEQYKLKRILSRKFSFKNGCSIIISLQNDMNKREISFLLGNNYDMDLLKTLPKWKGMEQRISIINDESGSNEYIIFSQLEGYEAKIYEAVMQDIINNMEKISSVNDLGKLLNLILSKWKNFFKNENSLVMQEIEQQGLYAELLMLEKLIKIRGSRMVYCWSGCEGETHDFYIDKNTVEVKSSSRKEQNMIKISSEYQLDNVGLSGNLYLSFFKLRKSAVDGEKLSDIVERIQNLLDDVTVSEFNDKLFKYGYLVQCKELYNYKFTLLEDSYYNVLDGFPRIVASNIPKGVSGISYTISLDACDRFQITAESFYNEVII
ncbi:PD-(D/E)XK motif protein [Clostridium chromiireducens]|uniref:PD-(D/E)XK motif protein n=1 Tax=Clostridium chromiireducens TaxID=225345 RepID=A0A399IIX8_9CLOT|nr:PD-(D/E)XK motif protein [Clostridium chromiireducens]RII32955.1 PD-(D/E)XK motif protein [Clostridium chromiireducens]